MPYIKKERREQLQMGLAGTGVATTAGELNYQITGLLLSYLYKDGHKFGYADINDVLGAIEGAKLEFYRRVAVPYENLKIGENGDVY